MVKLKKWCTFLVMLSSKQGSVALDEKHQGGGGKSPFPVTALAAASKNGGQQAAPLLQMVAAVSCPVTTAED